MKNYYTTQKYLKKFLREKRKLSDIGLRSINYKFVTDFEYYLKTYYRQIIIKDLATIV